MNGTSSTHRTVPDVSMDADPNTGVYVLDSFDGGYLQVGGTSLATPMWGGLIAIANQGRSLMDESSLNGLTQTLPTLYDLPSTDFHDITSGSNGTYSATPGYDLVTGLGTPVANLLVPALAGYPSTQPPSVSGPSAISVNENSTLLFAPSQSDLITLADSQAGSNADTLTLSVSDGTLALGSTSGLTSISGNGSATVTISGTLANLNAAINGLVYTPNTGYSGSAPLNISLTDPGDSLTGSATVAITVSPISPPNIAAPSNIDVNENSTLLFAPSQSDTITLSDSFAGSTPLTLTLSVNDGTLDLGSTNGLTSVSGNGSSTISVTGTLANLNADLNGLIYTPTAGFHGQDTLSFTVTDTGTNLSDSITTNIVVNPPSPPAVTVPGALSMNENTPVVFSSAHGTAIGFADSFAGSTSETLTLNVTSGSLVLGSTSGLTSVSGNDSASITATGTLAELNAAVSGLTYTPNSGFSGSDSLQISLTDSGDNLERLGFRGIDRHGWPEHQRSLGREREQKHRLHIFRRKHGQRERPGRGRAIPSS